MASEIVKGYNMPIHTIPQDHEVIRTLVRDLCVLLSINPDDEKNQSRIPMTELMIRESANRLTPQEIRAAFIMYAKGELADLEPKDNYLTPILFNKVVTAYKQTKKTPPEPLPEVEYDEDIARQNVMEAYYEYKETGSVSLNFASAFDRLIEWGILPKKGQNKKADERYDWYLHQAFGQLYDHTTRTIREEKALPGASTPKLLQAKAILSRIMADKWASPDIQALFRCMVLEGFFKKLTETELKEKLWIEN